MENPPLPEPRASTAPLSPATRAAAEALARALAYPGVGAQALRSAALALVAAVDADSSDTPPDHLDRAGFDRAELARLFTLTGPEVAGDLVLRLTEDLRASRAALSPAGPTPSLQVLRAQAHVLVGLGGSVGATRLHDAAQKLGRACRTAPDAVAVATERTQVLAAIDAALTFLDAQGASLPARLLAGA